MSLGIAAHGNVKRSDTLRPGDKVGCVGVTSRMRFVSGAYAGYGIAPKSDNATNAGAPIGPKNVIDLLSGGGDARDVSCGGKPTILR
jgi:hypothetical protein